MLQLESTAIINIKTFPDSFCLFTSEECCL